jgi:hypothetical protein
MLIEHGLRAPHMKGYYLYPDIHGDELAFVSDDDVWITGLSPVQPRRLTVGFGVVTKPRFSPDGKWIAFRGRKGTDEVVAEVYVMPSEGGEARRLTYFGSALTDLAGWTLDEKVVVVADSGTPFRPWRDLVAADRCFTLVVSGQPDDFTVHIGIGRWIQNIGVAAVEALFLSLLFLAVDVPEMLWTTHVEAKLAKEIQSIVG